MKRIMKVLLSLNLVFGLCFVGNKKIQAVEERGSVVQYSYLTTTTTETTYGGTVTIRLKVATINDGITTSMSYVVGGSTCSTNVSGMTCTISNDSSSGNSYLGSNSTLTVLFTVNLKKTTSTTNLDEHARFQAFISKNKLTGIERL